MGNQQTGSGCCSGSRLKDSNMSFQELDQTLDKYIKDVSINNQFILDESSINHPVTPNKFNKQQILIDKTMDKLQEEKAMKMLDNTILDKKNKDFVVKEEYINRKIRKAESIIELAKARKEKGKYRDAVKLYLSGVLILRKYYGLNSEKVFVCLCNAASIYREQSDLRSAMLLYKRTLQTFTNDFSVDLEKIVILLNNIGLIYKDNNDIKKGIQYFEKGLSLLEKDEKCDKLIYIQIMVNHGQCYQEMNELEQAIDVYYQIINKIHQWNDKYPLIFKAYQSYQKQLQNVCANVLNNIGQIYMSCQQFKQAATHYLLALQILENIYPEKRNVRLQNIYNNIAQMFIHQQQFDQAKHYLLSSLQIRDQIIKQENIDSARIYNNLGIIHEEQGQLSEALQFYLRAVEVVQEQIGQKSLEYIQVKVNIYRVGLKMNKFQESISACEELESLIDQCEFGILEIKIKVLLNKGWIYKQMKQYEYCQQIFKKIENIVSREKGKVDQCIPIYMNCIIAETYCLMNDNKSGFNYYQKSKTLVDNIDVPQNLRAQVYFNYGLLFNDDHQKVQHIKQSLVWFQEDENNNLDQIRECQQLIREIENY